MKYLLMATLLSINLYANSLQTQDEHGDYSSSWETWTTLANKNDPEGLLNLGTLYLEGLGTKQDTNKGIELYTKSARIGYVLAQESLVDIYCNGRYVKQDLRICAYWANKAETKFVNQLWNKYELWNYITLGKR